MTRHTLIGIAMALASATAQADDVQTVTIGGNTIGKQATTITFDGGNLTVGFADGTSQTASMEQVNIRFAHTAHLSDAAGHDNVGTLRTFAGKTTDVKVSRYMKARQWALVCLPFDMSHEAIATAFGSTARVASLSSVEEGVAHFATASAMRAGLPYLVCPSSDVETFTIPATTLQGMAEGATVSAEGVDLKGVMTATTPAATATYIAQGNRMKRLSNDGTVKALHGYFALSEVATLNAFTVDGETIGQQATLDGDVNDDAVVNVGDVTMVINAVMGEAPVGFNTAAADIDGDGVISVQDVLIIINIALGNDVHTDGATGNGSDIATNSSNTWEE